MLSEIKKSQRKRIKELDYIKIRHFCTYKNKNKNKKKDNKC